MFCLSQYQLAHWGIKLVHVFGWSARLWQVIFQKAPQFWLEQHCLVLMFAVICKIPFGTKDIFMFGEENPYEDSFRGKWKKWGLRNLLLFPAGIQLKEEKGEIGRVWITSRRQPCEHNCWKGVWLTKLNVSVWTIYNLFNHEPSLIYKGIEHDGNFESAIPNKHLKEISCGCVWKSLNSSSHIQGWI